ncbi:MAG: AEC family transporter [Proteobacteria bacterium]|nr:AEC family transporter [Pseudomonadota bacterium]
MEKLLFSLTLIISGLVVGYTLRLLTQREVISLPVPIADLRKILQKIGLLFFLPISFMTAVWVVHFSDLRIALLPIVGVSALSIGGALGVLFARISGASPRQSGVLFCCSSFTNIGAIGALVCYMFLGEAGFALVALYKMFEEIAYYTIGFPIARYYSGNARDEEKPVLVRIVGIISDPFVASILTAFLAGVVLNLTGIRRPPVFETINSLFIPAGTFVLIVSIGLGMQLSRIGHHLRAGLAVTFIKSVLIPAAVTTLAWLAGFGDIDNGLPLKVVLILSSMPVAFNSLVAASIYDLDLDLANSCWLISTLSLCIVMPWLFWILQFI